MLDIGTLRVKVDTDITALDVLATTLAAIGAASVKTAADVSKNMTLAKETFGATTDEAANLAKAMNDAAAASIFTTKDASAAMLNFARAGLEAEEACSAIAPAMNLAAGEAGDLETVSQGLVGTINAFGDSFDDTGHYADVFASACNNSALEINSLSHSISAAAPAFSAAGYSVEDLTTMMGILGNNGIEANRAATALRSGMTMLISPTKKAAETMAQLGIEILDSNGNVKDAVTLQSDLHDAFSRLSEAEQTAAAASIFGKNRMSEWLALIKTAPSDFNELNTAINNSAGTTTRMAAAMQQGLGGSIESLKSSINVLATQMGDLMGERLIPIIQHITELVDGFNELDDDTKNLIIDIGGSVVAFAGVVTGVTLVTKGITALRAELTMLLANPVVATVAAVTAGVILLAKAVNDHEAAVKREVEAMHPEITEYNSVAKSAEDAAKAVDKEVEATNKALATSTATASSNNKLAQSYVQMAKGVETGRYSQSSLVAIQKQLTAAYPELNRFVDESTGLFQISSESVVELTEHYGELAEAAAYQDALTESTRQYTEAEVDRSIQLENQTELYRQYNEVMQMIEDRNNGLISTDRDLEQEAQGLYDAIENTKEAIRTDEQVMADAQSRTEAYTEKVNGLAQAADQAASSSDGMNAALEETAAYEQAQQKIESLNTQMSELIKSFEGLSTATGVAAGQASADIQSIDDVTNMIAGQQEDIDVTAAALDGYANKLQALTGQISAEDQANLDQFMSTLTDVEKVAFMQQIGQASADEVKTIAASLAQLKADREAFDNEMVSMIEGTFNEMISEVSSGMNDIGAEVTAKEGEMTAEAPAAGGEWAASWVEGAQAVLSSSTLEAPTVVGGTGGTGVDGSHANGLPYVPFDGYIAELHKGEMVIPSKESEQIRNGGLGKTIIQNIEITVPDNSQAMQNALQIREELRNATYGYN